MIRDKWQRWCEQKVLPQRLLLVSSLPEAAMEEARTIAEALNGKQSSDILLFADNKESIRIGEESDLYSVRGLISWVHRLPVDAYRIVILENINRASMPALQALLKVLEEPPPQALFLLTSRNPYQLPETILSRLRILFLPQEEPPFTFDASMKQFLEGEDLLEKFRKIEDLTKGEGVRERALSFLEALIAHARAYPAYRVFLEILFETQESILKNVNVRLSLERLALMLTLNENN